MSKKRKREKDEGKRTTEDDEAMTRSRAAWREFSVEMWVVCVDCGTCDDGATDVKGWKRHRPACEEEELFGLGQHHSLFSSLSLLCCCVFVLSFVVSVVKEKRKEKANGAGDEHQQHQQQKRGR